MTSPLRSPCSSLLLRWSSRSGLCRRVRIRRGPYPLWSSRWRPSLPSSHAPATMSLALINHLAQALFLVLYKQKRLKNLFFNFDRSSAFRTHVLLFCWSPKFPTDKSTCKTSRCQAPSFHCIVLPVTFSVRSSSTTSLLCRKAITECAWQCHTVRVYSSR